MNYTTLEAALEQAGLVMEVDALSVYRAFEHIQDGRHKQGVRTLDAQQVTQVRGALPDTGGSDET